MIKKSIIRIYMIPLFIILSGQTYLSAHGLNKTLSVSDKANVLTVLYATGQPFAYEEYEIFPPVKESEKDAPFQVGRTDANGRIVFLPDRSGTWKIRYNSQDGHGGETEVTIDESGVAEKAEPSFFERMEKPITGAGILLGITGAAVLLYSRRKDNGNSGK
jgi:nickel transport protein